MRETERQGGASRVVRALRTDGPERGSAPCGVGRGQGSSEQGECPDSPVRGGVQEGRHRHLAPEGPGSPIAPQASGDTQLLEGLNKVRNEARGDTGCG